MLVRKPNPPCRAMARLACATGPRLRQRGRQAPGGHRRWASSPTGPNGAVQCAHGRGGAGGCRPGRGEQSSTAFPSNLTGRKNGMVFRPFVGRNGPNITPETVRKLFEKRCENHTQKTKGRSNQEGPPRARARENGVIFIPFPLPGSAAGPSRWPDGRPGRREEIRRHRQIFALTRSRSTRILPPSNASSEGIAMRSNRMPNQDLGRGTPTSGPIGRPPPPAGAPLEAVAPRARYLSPQAPTRPASSRRQGENHEPGRRSVHPRHGNRGRHPLLARPRGGRALRRGLVFRGPRRGGPSETAVPGRVASPPVLPRALDTTGWYPPTARRLTDRFFSPLATSDNVSGEARGRPLYRTQAPFVLPHQRPIMHVMFRMPQNAAGRVSDSKIARRRPQTQKVVPATPGGLAAAKRTPPDVRLGGVMIR